MFTVVIAEQSYLDDLKRFSSYMAPYMKNRDVSYCRWDPDARTLDEAVPELDRTVATVRDWRAVILFGEPGQAENRQRNPFCGCTYMPPERETDESMEGYYLKVLQEKARVYHEAAHKPLTKLATWLNCDPTVSEPIPMGDPYPSLPDMQELDEEDKIFRWEETMQLEEYYAEAAVKAETRRQIRDGSQLRAPYPKEIVCIAPRTFDDKVDEISTAWEIDISRTYSEFCDWNLYYDKMRFLAFDLLPRTQTGYDLDVLRYLSTVACFAANPTPTDAIKPGILYRFVCEANENALRKTVCDYDAKLRITEEVLEKRIRRIREKERAHLTDREAERLFCLNEPIAVTIPPEADKDGLYVPRNGLGLAEDTPQDELLWWQAAYITSVKAVRKLLKLPARGVKRAAESLHGRECADLSSAAALNEFQFEDVIEHTRDEELRMIGTGTCDFYDIERYEKKMAEADNAVQAEIRRRMTGSVTAAIFAVVLACCAACFLPMLFSNGGDAKSVTVTLLLMGVSVALLAVVMLIVLLVLRGILKRRIGDYNEVIGTVEAELNESVAGYSQYLSHACNVLRGNSVINYRTCTGDPDQKEILILKKHIHDIEESRAALAELFLHYLNPRAHTDLTPDDAYLFDFSRPEEYEYLISFSDDQAAKLEFFGGGNFVTVPVNFLCRISAEREELYD